MTESERDVVVGKIVAPFGVRGELKVVALTDFPERFDKGNELIIAPVKGDRRSMRVLSSSEHKGGYTVKLEGVDSREDAEALRGAQVIIDESELAELPEDKYYLFDIVGLKVVTDDGREFGEVTEVLQASGNDVYITSTGLCIPALKTVVAKVDVDAGLMVIRPVPGLLPEDKDAD